MNWKIPLFKTYSDQEDVEAVTRIIKRGTYWAVGPEIEEFERKIADFVGVKYTLSFNSGTSALHTLLLAHDIKNKEVIVPSFTFIATPNAVLLAGGIPVFAESESETFGLCAEDVKKRINEKTKAIILIHYGGLPGKDTEKLKKIADENNILLIEDAAESLGSIINNKKVGSLGHSAIFSFCQNKILATGEGGLITTDSEEIYKKAKLIRSHGRVENNGDYFSSVEDNDYVQIGYNFRMPTMIAALGLSQFNKINKVIELRRNHTFYLNKELSKILGIRIPSEIKGHFRVYQMYTIQLDNEKIRNNLQEHLTNKGIMTKVYFNPIHLKTLYKERYNYNKGELPLTEELSKRVLTLPLYPDLNKEQLDYIIESINEFFGDKKNGRNI